MEYYLFVFACSLVLGCALVPAVIRLARRMNLTDAPNARKVHSEPIPRIGGVAIFLSTITVVMSGLFFKSVYMNPGTGIDSDVLCILVSAGLLFLVGIIDDVIGLRARFKLLCQFLAAVFYCAFGGRINMMHSGEALGIWLDVLSWPLTIIWLIGITNAINLIDGLDGLAASISAITCGVILLLSIYFGLPVIAVLMACLLGALCAFLYFNFHPAKIFMGDSGSLFIGFSIAASAVACSSKVHHIALIGLPILALAIPIFDTLVSMLRRFLERRSMFSPDRGHFHHKLLDLGLSHRQVVTVACGISFLSSFLGAFMIWATEMRAILILSCMLILLFLAFQGLGLIRVPEIVSDIQRKHHITVRNKNEKQRFEEAELHFKRAQSFSEWWRSVCHAAENMGFVMILLPFQRPDGKRRILAWEKNDRKSGLSQAVKVKIPIRNPLVDAVDELEIEIRVNDSLESVGHRLSLFTRLLEKYAMADFVEETNPAIAEPYACCT